MNTLLFKITNIHSIDSYLYAGNLYVIFADGRIAYVSYDFLVHKLREAYPCYDKLLSLAFLHNDYVNSNQGQLILGINGVKTAIQKQWELAVKEINFEINYNEIANSFHTLGTWQSIPLDMRIYAMRLFLGCGDGMYETSIIPETKNKIKVSGIQRILDTKVVAINAKYGAIAISADQEGLFTAEILDDLNTQTKINDKAIVQNRSLRSEWKDIDLLSYKSDNEFCYIHNNAQRLSKNDSNFYSLWKGGERRRISQIGVEINDMSPLMKELGLNADDVDYCFNSNSSTFIKLKNGELRRADFKHRSGGSEMSSEILFSKGRNQNKKIISTSIIPNGCVLNFYDRVEMSREGKSYVLLNAPAYNVRSYMTATRYRSMLTVNTEEELILHSTETFTPILVPNENSLTGRVLNNNVFKSKNQFFANTPKIIGQIDMNGFPF